MQYKTLRAIVYSGGQFLQIQKKYRKEAGFLNKKHPCALQECL